MTRIIGGAIVEEPSYASALETETSAQLIHRPLPLYQRGHRIVLPRVGAVLPFLHRCPLPAPGHQICRSCRCLMFHAIPWCTKTADSHPLFPVRLLEIQGPRSIRSAEIYQSLSLRSICVLPCKTHFFSVHNAPLRFPGQGGVKMMRSDSYSASAGVWSRVGGGK